MPSVQSTRPTLIKQLEQAKFLIRDIKERTYQSLSALEESAFGIFTHKEKSIEDLGKSICLFMDNLEKTPVFFGGSPKLTLEQQEYFSACFKAADLAETTLKGQPSPVVKQQLALIAQRTAALQYRIEGVNGGENAIVPTVQDLSALFDLAANWKVSTPIFIDKTLSQRDKDKIEKACKYPLFTKVLFADKSLQSKFFNWTLKDNMDVDVFVQFPATCARIKSAFLAARIGRLGKEMCKIEKVPLDEDLPGRMQKVVSLPFDTGDRVEQISILDESKEVNLNGTWKLTIKKILDIFSTKNTEIGDVDFFKSTGITSWNGFELGRWNPEKSDYDRVDLFKDDWWNDLPILEEISKSEVEKRYAISLEDGQWLVCGKSGRESTDLDLKGVHGFLEVLIPTDIGTYRLYPIGNFASRWPRTTFDLLSLLGDTKKGMITYPDENIFYSHRQIASYPIIISKEQGEKLMQSVQKDLIAARHGCIVFQFGGDNCAFWAFSKLKSIGTNLPNLYKIKLTEPTIHNPFLGSIFGLIKQAPESAHPSLFTGLYTLFGGHRSYPIFENGKRVYKCQLDSSNLKETTIFHPGYLHDQILNGTLPGVVTAGH